MTETIRVTQQHYQDINDVFSKGISIIQEHTNLPATTILTVACTVFACAIETYSPDQARRLLLLLEDVFASDPAERAAAEARTQIKIHEVLDALANIELLDMQERKMSDVPS